jgi:predicted secreted hydrolase
MRVCTFSRRIDPSNEHRTRRRCAAASGHPEVRRGVTLSFPRDHGAHPEFRTEWWYITGWLDTPDGRALGFQVTFFRTTVLRSISAMTAPLRPSRFCSHMPALSDPDNRPLLHDQRAARQGFGLAQASTADMDVTLDDWTLKRDAAGQMTTHAGGKDFTLDLSLTPAQPVMLQGEEGYSRKGPLVPQASHYYSMPHLNVSGTVTRNGKKLAVKGTAWLDREWSSAYLAPGAVGWDWVGFNFDDGSALMAFRIRDANGQALWAGGAYRDVKATLTNLAPRDVAFATVRRWRSPRTAADYPVEQTLSVRLPTGGKEWRITPLFDDQELDSRAGGGPVYWEGAARVPGGRGYLELTGYFKPLKM